MIGVDPDQDCLTDALVPRYGGGILDFVKGFNNQLGAGSDERFKRKLDNNSAGKWYRAQPTQHAVVVSEVQC